MKKTFLLLLSNVLIINYLYAQNYVLSPLGIKFPNYTTATRPAANSIGAGTVLYNSTDNTHQYSNGTAWLNLLGTTSVPSGTANQTLRNNGSGWIADGFMQNTGSRILVGSGVSSFTPGLLTMNATGTDNGIYVTSVSAGIVSISQLTGLYGEGSTYGVKAFSNSGTGVYADAIYGTGVYASSTYGSGIFAQSISGNAIEAVSASSYSGRFNGRLRIEKGGNGSAGIDYTNGINEVASREGFFGMGFANEMGLYGYGYSGWVQRWNVVTGTICHATAPTICSDIRLKKDFKVLSNSLSQIVQLQGYNYLLKNEKNPNLQTGFIAQEIQKIFPELVNQDSDGYLSVDYIGLIPHLVESVKSLKSENEELKESVKSLKSENEELKKRLLKIEELLISSKSNIYQSGK